jgi:hypothetical protein
MRLMQAELELINMVNAIESLCTEFGLVNGFTGLFEHTASNGSSLGPPPKLLSLLYLHRLYGNGFNGILPYWPVTQCDN